LWTICRQGIWPSCGCGAERYLRDESDPQLLELVDDLRGDEQWWVHLWAPGAAMAARRLGDPQAAALLTEAIDSGFSQPELFDGDLEKAFGADPDWPDLQRRMEANIPLPVIELIDWPDPPPTLPLTLYEIGAHRLDELRARLPEPSDSAWQTAMRLLEWVHDSWDHGETAPRRFAYVIR
jgi:hypothetical protein